MKIMTEKEVADLLKVSPTTLGDLRRSNKGPPYVKIGGQIRYIFESILEWVKKEEINK